MVNKHSVKPMYLSNRIKKLMFDIMIIYYEIFHNIEMLPITSFLSTTINANDICT